jgi:hypothetical protein
MLVCQLLALMKSGGDELTWVLGLTAGVARDSLEVGKMAVVLREEVLGSPLDCQLLLAE